MNVLFVCVQNAGRSEAGERVREIRDEIGRRVGALVLELDGERPAGEASAA